jgi:hypothetical protein
MEINISLVLSVSVAVLQLFLIPVLTWVFNRLIRQLDATTKLTEEIGKSLIGIQKDVETALKISNETASMREAIGVLKRDQAAIWRRVDELKEGLKDDIELGRRSSEKLFYLSNKIQILKMKAQENGWNIEGEWTLDERN